VDGKAKETAMAGKRRGEIKGRARRNKGRNGREDRKMGGEKRNELRKNDRPTVISLLAVGAYAPYRDSWTHAHLSQRGRETYIKCTDYWPGAG